MSKKSLCTVLLSIALMTVCASTGHADGSKDIAEKYLQALQKGNYKQAYDYFSDGLKQLYPLDKYSQEMTDIKKQYGEMLSFSDKLPTAEEGYEPENELFDASIFESKNDPLLQRYAVKHDKITIVFAFGFSKKGRDYLIELINLQFIGVPPEQPEFLEMDADQWAPGLHTH